MSGKLRRDRLFVGMQTQTTILFILRRGVQCLRNAGQDSATHLSSTAERLPEPAPPKNKKIVGIVLFPTNRPPCGVCARSSQRTGAAAEFDFSALITLCAIINHWPQQKFPGEQKAKRHENDFDPATHSPESELPQLRRRVGAGCFARKLLAGKSVNDIADISAFDG